MKSDEAQGVENEQRATIFAKEAEAQKWANEAERLREAIRRYIQADNKLSSDMIGGHDEYNRWRKQWNAALKELREIAREGK